MTTHQVTYRGPSTFAVRAAALLADATGVELTSANRTGDPSDDAVALELTIEGADETVAAAIDSVRAELPAGATLV
ncbi:MAG TPA: hypothetical protein VM388_13610 [Acidimicrobiales bacterium]|nr:hypothetical protein [Acidimicrobiales bacterium]HWI03984.1 hypothetical protein [Acidimicrobiales bacterium]